MRDGQKILTLGLATLLLLPIISIPATALVDSTVKTVTATSIEPEKQTKDISKEAAVPLIAEEESSEKNAVQLSKQTSGQLAATSYEGDNAKDMAVYNPTEGNTTDNETCLAETGDANMDGFIDIDDITLIIEYAFSGAQLPACNGADFNEDGIINIHDAVALVNFIFGEPPDPIPGDADGTGTVDILDVEFLIAYIFQGGPAPDPIWSGDADGSCNIDISDVCYLIAYIFESGPAPIHSSCPTIIPTQYTEVDQHQVAL